MAAGGVGAFAVLTALTACSAFTAFAAWAAFTAFIAITAFAFAVASGSAGQGRVELESQSPLDAGDLGWQAAIEAQIDIGAGIDADAAASAGQRTEARRIG